MSANSPFAFSLLEWLLASHPTLRLLFSYLLLGLFIGLWWGMKRWLRRHAASSRKPSGV